MKIGFLKCGSAREELIPRFGDYEHMFEKKLQNVRPNIELEVFNVWKGELPTTLRDYQGFIIGGSDASVNDNEDWIQELKVFIETLHFYKIKIIGICFGHQVVAESLGGKVSRNDEGWGVGAPLVKTYQTLDWMFPPLERYSILLSHEEQVQELPHMAERVGGNDFCKNSMFIMDNHILCMQGHPEYEPDYAKKLYELSADSIGEERMNDSLKAVEHKLDDSTVIHWMINFLEF